MWYAVLFAIGGSLELIGSATRTNDRVQVLIERAGGAVERGSRLVSSLLAFGRRQMLQKTALDVNLRIIEFLPIIRKRCGDRPLALPLGMHAAQRFSVR